MTRWSFYDQRVYYLTDQSGLMPNTEGHIIERKERERLGRRRAILEAARDVFARNGYGSATLDEIAEKSQFAKGTLYNYFESKEDIFHHLLESMLDNMLEVAENAIAQAPDQREAFRRYAVNMIEYYKGNEDIFRIIVREMNRMQPENERTKVRQVLVRIREIAVRLGNILDQEQTVHQKERVNTRDLAQVFVSMVHSRSMHCSFEQNGLGSLDAAKEAEFLINIFFDGVTPR